MYLAADWYLPYYKATREVSATREYYPCIFYKTLTSDDQTFYTIESMHGGPYSSLTASDTLECRLSFNCDKNQKVFYKLKKDCSCHIMTSTSRFQSNDDSYITLAVFMTIYP